MTSKEALESIKNWVEYITRLDYVEPIVREEVKQLLYDAYHKTTPEFEQIQKDLEVLKTLRKLFKKELFIYQREDIDNKFTCQQIYHIAKASNGDNFLFNNQQDILKLKEWLDNE